MSSAKQFESMLTGGHPNSLGRTEEVVELVLADKKLLKSLFDCYKSDDEVVRLRVSSAFKRIFRAKQDWFPAYIDRFQALIPKLRQPSAQWTLAQLHLELRDLLSAEQKRTAISITKHQLEDDDDWIVLIQSINLLEHWAATDKRLRTWLTKRVSQMTGDRRKTVSKRAKQSFEYLSGL